MIIAVYGANGGSFVATLAIEAMNSGMPVGNAASDVILDPLPLPKETRSVQTEDIALSTGAAFTAERGNRKVSLEFSVKSFFTTRDAAMAWIMNLGTGAYSGLSF